MFRMKGLLLRQLLTQVDAYIIIVHTGTFLGKYNFFFNGIKIWNVMKYSAANLRLSYCYVIWYCHFLCICEYKSFKLVYKRAIVTHVLNILVFGLVELLYSCMWQCSGWVAYCQFCLLVCALLSHVDTVQITFVVCFICGCLQTCVGLLADLFVVRYLFFPVVCEYDLHYCSWDIGIWLVGFEISQMVSYVDNYSLISLFKMVSLMK